MNGEHANDPLSHHGLLDARIRDLIARSDYHDAGWPSGRSAADRSPFGRPALGTARLVDVRPYEAGDPLELPLYLSRVAAGFASPADDHIDQKLDLNAHCVQNPAATHLARVEGDSMIERGIHDGDVAVIDRSLEPKDGDIVVAALDGELTVKELRVRGKNGGRRVWLVAANESYAPVEVLEGHELVIWGVVTHVVHACR